MCLATDSAANCVRMRELVKINKPKLLYVGCQAHWCNLLLKDISSNHNDMMQRILDCNQWFTNTHAPHALLKAKGIAMPPKPTETRWNSKYDAVVYYNKHWSDLVSICATLLLPNHIIRCKRFFFTYKFISPFFRCSLENIQIRRAGEELQLMYTPVAVCAWTGSKVKGDHSPTVCKHGWLYWGLFQKTYVPSLEDDPNDFSGNGGWEWYAKDIPMSQPFSKEY